MSEKRFISTTHFPLIALSSFPLFYIFFSAFNLLSYFALFSLAQTNIYIKGALSCICHSDQTPPLAVSWPRNDLLPLLVTGWSIDRVTAFSMTLAFHLDERRSVEGNALKIERERERERDGASGRVSRPPSDA